MFNSRKLLVLVKILAVVIALMLTYSNASANGSTGSVKAVAAGVYADDYMAALKSDGSVWTWGRNNWGQLGNNTILDSTVPVQVISANGIGYLTGISSIASGGDHTVALDNSKNVWTWGYNGSGQLGISTSTSYSALPVPVSGVSSVTAIAGGLSHTLSLTSAGNVWAWGSGGYGELGNRSVNNSSSPVEVYAGSSGNSKLNGVTAISAGNEFSVALKSGNVYSWGYNNYGQLGNSSTTSYSYPVQATGVSGVTAISAGAYHTLALDSSGNVWAWGRNNNGQLGDGTTTDRHVPTKITTLTSVIAIAAGGYHSVALKSDGTVWAWGSGGYGQLGDGLATASNVPIQVFAGSTAFSSIAAGESYTAAIKADGSVWTWGYNNHGQLGNGTTSNSLTPVLVRALTESIASGEQHSVVLRSDGTVWAWGYNGYGQLGNNSTSNSSVPVEVSSNGNGYLTGVTAVAAGDNHTIALMSGGTLSTWGRNNYGQLGNGSITDSSVPVQPSPTGVTAIAGGGAHTIALNSVGSVKAWGYNAYGQLGNNSTTDSHVPVQVNSLTTGVTAIAAGKYHSMALNSAGSVKAWGQNKYGQLGDSTTTERHTPVQVSGLTTGVTAIAAGGFHSLALTSGGAVYAWGYNAYGQLGNNSTTDSHSPVQLSSLTNVIAIAAGEYHSVALKNDGTVWAWGYNANGQLGNGSSGNYIVVPVQVFDASGSVYLTGVTAIAAGEYHTIAMKSDGSAWAWGASNDGQLGNGTNSSSSLPVLSLLPRNIYPATSSGSGTLSCTPTSVNSGAYTNCTGTPSGGYSFYSLGPSGTNCGTGQWQTFGSVATAGPVYSDDCYVVAVFKPLITVTPAVSGGNGTISPSTPVSVAYGLTTQFTLAPTPGYTASVTDTCGSTGGNSVGSSFVNNIYTTGPVYRNCTVTATFTLNYYTVTSTGSGTHGTIVNNASITNGSETIAYNGTATFTVTPDTGSGYTASVSDTCTTHGSLVGNTYTISNITSGCGVTAAFNLNAYTVTSTGSGSGGAITPSSQSVSYGGTTTFTVTPTAGYTASVGDNCGSTGGNSVGSSFVNNIYTTGPVYRNCTVTATFTLNYYTVTSTGSGTHGTIVNNASITNGSETIAYNGTATFTVTPDTGSGYTASVSDTCTTHGSLVGNTYTISNITSGCGVTAAFNLNAYTVTSTGSGSGGSITPSSQSVSYGGTTTFTLLPTAGYTASVISDTCGSTGYLDINTNIYTTGTITKSCTVTAAFTLNSYTVTPTVAAGTDGKIGGTTYPTSPQTISYNGTAAFTLSPTAGYYTSVSDDCGSTGFLDISTNIYTTGKITKSCTVTATFSPNGISGTINTGGRAGGVYGPVTITLTEQNTHATYTFQFIDGVYAIQYIPPGYYSVTANMLGEEFPAYNYIVTIDGAGRIDGSSGGLASGYDFTATTDTYTVTPSLSGSGGTISPSTAVSVAYGGTATFTVLPIAGYVVHSVTDTCGTGGVGNGTLTGDTYTTGAVTSACTVTAAFTQNAYSAITAGGLHTAALRNDGTIWAWGFNYQGQLGSGSNTDSWSPEQVVDVGYTGLSGFTSIASGFYHTIALKSDGTVWTWGYNVMGQLGDGTTTDRNTPVQVTGITGAVAAIGGGVMQTTALMGDGTVYAWGYNGFGQLGDGTTTDRHSPVKISGLTGVSEISSSWYHTAVLMSNGTVWTWGYNGAGQLGNGNTTNSLSPVQVSGLTGVSAIATGYLHTAALKMDGTVWMWGDNTNGQLGDGTTTDRLTPVAVVGPSGPGSYLTGIVAIASEYETMIALRNDGTVWTWGLNSYGGLGNGTTTNSTKPVQVTGFASGWPTAIAAGTFHMVTENNDGTLYDWGLNSYGQLGDGTTTDRHNPAQVGFLGSYTVTPSVSGTGGSINPSTPVSVNLGKTFTFTVTPNTGYAILEVTGCRGTLSGNTYTTGAITANCTVTATFTQDKTIKLTASGANGGTITDGGGSINATWDGSTLSGTASEPINGTSHTLTATTNSASVFVTFSGCDSYTGNGTTKATCSINVVANRTVTAAFTTTDKTITVTASGANGGTITDSGGTINATWNGTGFDTGSITSETVAINSTRTLTATTTNNRKVTFSGCDTYTSNGGSTAYCNINRITANKSVSAVFK
ncbi:MAG: hypothetical protein HQK98_03410 [Nitrospirae bacterium]|nr:hypothetical protein [Nitrospirota bacterium]